MSEKEEKAKRVSKNKNDKIKVSVRYMNIVNTQYGANGFGELGQKFKGALAWKFALILDKMRELTKPLESVRSDIVSREALKDDKGKNVTIGNVVQFPSDEVEAAVSSEINEILNKEESIGISYFRYDKDVFKDFNGTNCDLLMPLVHPDDRIEMIE